ncbi:MAG: hypothetical protein ACK4ZU_02090 [Allorhizobium sp.]
MARPKLGKSETERLHIKITADELKAIDQWQTKTGIASRSEAVRILCSSALYAIEKRALDRITAIKLMALTEDTFRNWVPTGADEALIEMGKQAIRSSATYIDTRPYTYEQMRSSAFQGGAAPDHVFEEIATVAAFVRSILLHYHQQEKEAVT